MPIETRIIAFSQGEIKEALSDFALRANRAVPSHRMRGLTITNKEEVKATLPGGPDHQMITFNEREIAAAMIIYCSKKKIPIARRSLKSVQLEQDGVSLHLTTTRRPEIG